MVGVRTHFVVVSPFLNTTRGESLASCNCNCNREVKTKADKEVTPVRAGRYRVGSYPSRLFLCMMLST